MITNRQKGLIGGFVALLLIGVAGIVYTSKTRNVVPDDFKNARLQGALISQNIVDLSNQLVGDLTKMNTQDKQGDYNAALATADSLIAQSQDIRKKAQELSQELEKMTKALDQLKNSDARDVALASITARLEMINRLISYSDATTDLLTALRSRFSGTTSQSQAKVNELVQKINAEVEQVNVFNKQATESMNRFDEIIRGK